MRSKAPAMSSPARDRADDEAKIVPPSGHGRHPASTSSSRRRHRPHRRDVTPRPSRPCSRRSRRVCISFTRSAFSRSACRRSSRSPGAGVATAPSSACRLGRRGARRLDRSRPPVSARRGPAPWSRYCPGLETLRPTSRISTKRPPRMVASRRSPERPLGARAACADVTKRTSLRPLRQRAKATSPIAELAARLRPRPGRRSRSATRCR